GIRFEVDKDGKVSPSGVVFNEMKGAYSNHDSIAAEYSYRGLFPDTPYQYDSGGEPADIPTLSYSDFCGFHKKYYHPSNCRIFLYGNIETEKQLEFLKDNVFCHFSSGVDTAQDIALQPNWLEPQSLRVTTPLSESEESSQNVTISLNWKCGTTQNVGDILAFEVLSEILLGNMGSPLYRAIVESGLGEDLSPLSGLDSDLREMVFSVGVRGSLEERAADFEQMVFGVLKELAEDGIPENVLKGALHRVEFRNREIRGGAPFGLRLMGRSLRGWLHGGSPLDTIGFKKPMEDLRSEIEKDSKYFEKLILKNLVDNKHRLLVSIVPDNNYNIEMEQKITKASESEYRDPAKIELFKKFQDTPDPEELLEKIPSLEIDDVPKKIRKIDTKIKTLCGRPLYQHDLFTNGIIYIDFAIDVRDIQGEEGFLLPFLSRMLCSSGLPGKSYDQVALDVAQKTGGVFTFLESSRTAGDNPVRKDYLFFRLKTLENDLSDAFELFSDMLRVSEIGDPARVKDLLLEMRNDFKAGLIPAGHSFCSVMAAAQFDKVFEREDQWRGCSQLLFLDKKVKELESEMPELCKKLLSLREKLLEKGRLLFNITCSGNNFEKVEEKIEGFLTDLPSIPSPDYDAMAAASLDIRQTPSFKYGALSVPSAVNFSAMVMPASSLGSELHAKESILAHLMKTNDLWEEVRMRNGAYGVYASVNGTESLFTVSTFRDPMPDKNLKALESALKSASTGRYKKKDLKNAIITVIGRDLKPLSPGEESLIGFRRELYLITEDIRQQKRNVILNMTAADIEEAASFLIESLKDSVAVVMGSEETIENVAAQFGSEIKEHTIKLPL
ncbi:MAG: insulinase family protein, partial [Spirochaetales bacterium]|nr:insulinase family protein [Spirochaetales bacterium]